MEATGILGQAFRCFCVPLPNPDDEIEGHVQILSLLQSCPAILRERLKSGTPTGNILNDVLGKKEHSSKLHPIVKKRLENIQGLAKMSNGAPGPEGIPGAICRTCSKSQWDMSSQSLMRCSRCRSATYCSRACQVKDWKAHKAVCNLGAADIGGGGGGKKNNKASAAAAAAKQDAAHESAQTMVLSFVQNNYFKIMDEILRKSKETRLKKAKLVLEIDFYDDAPALRGKFKIGVTDRYIQGNRPDEPNWFCKGESTYEGNVQRWLVGVEDHYKRLTTDHLLTLCRYNDGSSGVYRVALLNPETNRNILSDEALEAIRTENRPLMQRILGKEHTATYLSHKCMRAAQGDTKADRVLQTLLAFGFQADGPDHVAKMRDRINGLEAEFKDDDEEF